MLSGPPSVHGGAPNRRIAAWLALALLLGAVAVVGTIALTSPSDGPPLATTPPVVHPAAVAASSEAETKADTEADTDSEAEAEAEAEVEADSETDADSQPRAPTPQPGARTNKRVWPKPASSSQPEAEDEPAASASPSTKPADPYGSRF